MVNTSRIVAILNSDSAPAKRLVQNAKNEDALLDGTQGRKTKSVIITDSGHIVLSALQTDTLSGRFSEKEP